MKKTAIILLALALAALMLAGCTGGGDDLSGQGSYGGSDATQTFPQGGRQRIY